MKVTAITSVLEAVGFDAASTASASALALPIAVISLVAIPPTKFEAPYCFQNPGYNILSSLSGRPRVITPPSSTLLRPTYTQPTRLLTPPPPPPPPPQPSPITAVPPQPTVVWINQESIRKYWATRSSVRSFARTAHSFARSLPSLPRSWDSE